MTAVEPARYAVYWAPARDHALWRAGCDWLGRDPESDVDGCAPPWATAPWRYGFHATLKAPLVLREGLSEPMFLAQVSRLARSQRPFALPRLAVSCLKDFIALRPVEPVGPQHALRALADACVVELDPCRRPLANADLDSRRAALSDLAAMACLQQWGHPHVLERWRFHMTLTDQGTSANVRLFERARRHFAAARAVPARVDSIAVLRQAAASTPFHVVARLPLALRCHTEVTRLTR